jgi:hypothetical protein
MTRAPSAVVTAAGSYHSRLFVAWGIINHKVLTCRFKYKNYPIVKVGSFPIWIVAGVERATGSIKFVREDEDIF